MHIENKFQLWAVTKIDISAAGYRTEKWRMLGFFDTWTEARTTASALSMIRGDWDHGVRELEFPKFEIVPVHTVNIAKSEGRKSDRL